MSGGSESDTVTYEERTNRVFVTLDDEANDGERGERDNVQTDVEVVLGGIQDDTSLATPMPTRSILDAARTS